jgi:integrase
MPRQREGAIVTKKGRLYARIRWTDPVTGKQREKYEPVKNRTAGKKWAREQLQTLETRGDKPLDANRMTFGDVLDRFEQTFVREAKYVGNRKVSGLRSLAPVRTYLKTLREHFGRKLLRSVTHASIHQYKDKRLDTPLPNGNQRTISGVQRELELLRRILNFAKAESWILENPFEKGSPLINKADESSRERILSIAEEARLLSVCNTPTREHLRLAILMALDTAGRKGELLGLRWRNVDFINRTITFETKTTKTLKQRQVPLSQRVAAELRLLQDKSPTLSGDDELFRYKGAPIKDSFKFSFGSACREAGIEGLHFHDLRHTATTRLVNLGVPAEIVMGITGHSQHTTFRRYVNADGNQLNQIAEILDKFHQQQQGQEQTGDAQAPANDFTT